MLLLFQLQKVHLCVSSAITNSINDSIITSCVVTVINLFMYIFCHITFNLIIAGIMI